MREHDGWGHDTSREEGVGAEGSERGTTRMRRRVAAPRGVGMRAGGTTGLGRRVPVLRGVSGARRE